MIKKLLFLIILALGTGVLFYNSPLQSKFNFPDVLSLKSDTQTSAVAETKPFWTPDSPHQPSMSAPPVINAKAGYLVDLTTNELLFSKNPDLRVPVASLQKIVTAMVALDHLDPNDYVSVSATASSREPDSMGLFPGEKLTVKQLLYGLLLVSGNDAATALAEKVSGTETQFTDLMNQKAVSLGLGDSKFINSNGLDEGHQYSSAFNMAAFSVHLLENYPLLSDIVASREMSFPYTVTEMENHKDYYVYNTSPLLDMEGFLGIKPGYTPEAGLCLISLIERNDHRYLIVVLGSEDRKGDSEALLDFALQN
jgi:D-alanyl-D-alanine carboxypeptidase (penicillin-binding protein 5/6)